MPYLFTCPHCQSQTRVEDRYSGLSGECFSCGKTIQLPSFAAGVNHASATRPNRRPVGILIAAGLVLTMLVCLLFAVMRFGGQSVARLADVRLQNSSIKNLEKITGALNAYAAMHGKYPPPALLDSNGMPTHSWRVLILPQLGEQQMFDMFDLSKPWNAEVNLQAAAYMPSVYQHPSDSSGYGSISGYYLVTGSGTLFPPTGPLGPKDVTDNPAQTILVIAGRPPTQSPLGAWAEPIDLDFAVMNGVINGTSGIEAGGWLESGVTMATVDERGHFLPKSTAPSTFNALISPRGGEPLSDDTLD